MRKSILCLGFLGCLYSSMTPALTLTSSAFNQGGSIPAVFTCEGAGQIPDLQWADIPSGVKTYALIMQDPDAPAGIWTHWVVFNIPAATTRWDTNKAAPAGVLQGRNSWGQLGYRGPCPPTGKHRYIFTLYALDTVLSLPAGASAAQVQAASVQHVLQQAVLMGTYQK